MLYIALIFYIFEKRTQILSPTISVLSLLFVNISLFISQEKAMKNPTQIYFVVIVLSLLFSNSSASQLNITNQSFFHFSRATKNHDSSFLDLGPLGGLLL